MRMGLLRGTPIAPPQAVRREAPLTAFYIFNGERLTLSQWAAELGVSLTTLSYRLRVKGWSIEKTLTTRSSSNHTKRNKRLISRIASTFHEERAA